jgi:hypothetical protein
LNHCKDGYLHHFAQLNSYHCRIFQEISYGKNIHRIAPFLNLEKYIPKEDLAGKISKK